MFFFLQSSSHEEDDDVAAAVNNIINQPSTSKIAAAIPKTVVSKVWITKYTVFFLQSSFHEKKMIMWKQQTITSQATVTKKRYNITDFPLKNVSIVFALLLYLFKKCQW